MNEILSFVTGVALSIGSFLGIYQPPVEPPIEFGSTTSINLAGTFPYFLAGSGISSSATSIVLTSFTLPQNSYPIQDADLDATFYITIEPGNRTKQEFASCTTVGTNTGGTVTLSGCTRGLSPITPYTASTTLKFVHAGGSTVILSNPPQIYEDIYDFVNAASFAGSVTATEAAKGISELATAAEQAASTVSGGSGPLVLQAQYATSTYNSATAANKVVVTGSGGTIDANFMPEVFTKNLSFSGTATSTFASTTVYATTTTGTWTKPSNLKFLIIEAVAGGGGGGGTTTGGRGAGGGGGGAYCRSVIPAAAIASTVTVTIGAAGTAGAATGGTGGTGGTTSFGTHVSAAGGTGGTDAVPSVGGTGGTCTTGDLKIQGSTGGTGIANSGATTASIGIGGYGGNSFFGYGGSQQTARDAGEVAGVVGTGYGAGGSGAVIAGNGSNDTAGGAGTAGLVVITSVFY